MENSENGSQSNELTTELKQVQRTIAEFNQDKNDITTDIKIDITKWLKKWIGILFGGISLLTMIALVQIYLSVVNKTDTYMTESIKDKFSTAEISKTLTEVAENQAKNIINNTLEPSIKRATELIETRTASFETTLNEFTEKYDAESDVLAEEVQFLKNRNDILKLEDDAIATGLAKPYDKLFEMFVNPKTEQEKKWAQAAILKVKGQFGTMTRMANTELNYTEPVTKQKFKDNEIPTEAILNDFHKINNWKHRGRALELLKSRKEFGVPECLLSAMKDDYLEVRKIAIISFEHITGYKGNDVFGDGGVLENKWWNKNKVEVEKKFKKLQTIEDVLNKLSTVSN